MSVSTATHTFPHQPAPAGSRIHTVAKTEADNGRTVMVLECRNPTTNEFFCYDVVVEKPKGGREVIFSGPNIGEALQTHFRLVTKFGGVAKPKTPEEKEAEKHKALDEIIAALDSSSVDFGRKQASVEEKNKRKAESDEANKKAYYKYEAGRPPVNPRECKHDMLTLDWKNSAVDVVKALGWDSSKAGRQSLAMSLGYRGRLASESDNRAMNKWLVHEVNRRFEYELMRRAREAKHKSFEPVFTPLDWDAHMEELEAKSNQAIIPPLAPDKPGQKISDRAVIEAKMKTLKKMAVHPTVKNHTTIVSAIKNQIAMVHGDLAELDKPSKKKWQRVLDKAAEYLRDTDDMTAEEMTSSELEEELIGFFEDTYGDDWEDLSTSEIYELLNDHWI